LYRQSNKNSGRTFFLDSIACHNKQQAELVLFLQQSQTRSGLFKNNVVGTRATPSDGLRLIVVILTQALNEKADAR